MPALDRSQIDTLPDDEDTKYAFGRVGWRTYIYKSTEAKFKAAHGGVCPDEWDAIRVLDSEPDLVWLRARKPGQEAVLQESANGRQQWRATFVRTPREIKRVQVQQWSVAANAPTPQRSISIPIESLPKLIAFFQFVLDLPENQIVHKARFDDQMIDEITRRISESARAAQDFVNSYPELVAALRKTHVDESALVQFLQSGQVQSSEMLNAVVRLEGKAALLNRLISIGVTQEEIANLTYRKEQLEIFRRLLDDSEYFNTRMRNLNMKQSKPEAVWQDFLERNRWIFGYGLNFRWLGGLEEFKPLEFKAIGGDSLEGAGVRMDAILKTRGEISSLCFVEIKHHRTSLLKQVRRPYRGEAWLPSDELSGGVAQIQRAVWKAMKRPLHQWTDKGIDAPVQPMALLVVGSLREFDAEHGFVEKEKYRSFELFRANTSMPEIITYDELYERCRFIVEAGDDAQSVESSKSQLSIEDEDDEIPF